VTDRALRTPSADATALQIAHAQALLEYARDDARHVYLRVTAGIAVLAFFFAKISSGEFESLSGWWKAAACAGIGGIAVGAFFSFQYVSETHRVRRAIATTLTTPASNRATNPDSLLTQLWDKRRRRTTYLGVVPLVAGAVLLAAVLAKVHW